MKGNIFQQSIVPNKPRILEQERVFVYVPKATKDAPGIASFNNRDFIVNNGHVQMTMPIQQQIEQLTNPFEYPSRIKVLEDEFVYTEQTSTLYDPVTGQSYSTDKAEVKFNRKQRNVFKRPDLIKVTEHDFIVDTTNDEYLYSFNKTHSPLNEKTFIQVDNADFKENNGIVSIDWPYAHHSGNKNTNGYGLIKIDEIGGYLKYSNGNLDLNYKKVFESSNAQIVPEYGGNSSTGWDKVGQYVDSNNLAIRNANGNIKLAIDKHSVGLSNVANRAFSDYAYSDFGIGMQRHFTNEFDTKLDKTTWRELFSDWIPPSNEQRTPQLRLDYLDNRDKAQQDEIDTLKSIKTFLGYFENEQTLNKAYPPSEIWLGCSASVFETSTYWMVVYKDDKYKWQDTAKVFTGINDFLETDATVIKPNGVQSIGSSGLLLQSDHVHPIDETRLAKALYEATTIRITSKYESDKDWVVRFWETDEYGIYKPEHELNIPYVRKSQGIHNWQGSNNIFVDSEISGDKYWAGTASQYGQEADFIDNNTIFFVDDGEDFTVEDFLTTEGLDEAGLTYDIYHQNEKIVTVTNDILDEIGKPMTIYPEKTVTGKQRYRLSPIREITQAPDGAILETYQGKLSPVMFDINRLIYSDENGMLKNLPIHSSNILITGGQTETRLDSNRVLLSTDSNKVVSFNSGSIENVPIVSDGNGGITRANLIANRIVITAADGGLATKNISQNSIIYISDNGPTGLPAGVANTGKVLGVNSSGSPDWVSIDTSKNLPVETLTIAPTKDNTNGTKLVILSSPPAAYFHGYLYLIG